MKVLILGCGPAGLFAAHAATQAGHDVRIYSRKRRSEMFGAQYLHAEIPGLTDGQTEGSVEYRLDGELMDYLHKVYGETLPDNVTVKGLTGKYPAWDIRAAYARAWDIYGPMVERSGIIDSGEFANALRRMEPDAVVSTIPAPDLCYKSGEHSFTYREVWAIGDAPERGVFAPDFVQEENVILYNGTNHTGWYRASRINGYNSVEWPENVKPPVEDVARITKPIKTNCDCFQVRNGLDKTVGNIPVFRIGRYGAWTRFGHSHEAYWRVSDWLEETQRNRSLLGRLRRR